MAYHSVVTLKEEESYMVINEFGVVYMYNALSESFSKRPSSSPPKSDFVSETFKLHPLGFLCRVAFLNSQEKHSGLNLGCSGKIPSE